MCEKAASEPVETEPEAEAEAVEPEPTPEPVQFTITLTKNKKKPLGLDISHVEGIKLKVKSVKDVGLVKEWNDKNPDQAIQGGDHIIKVGAVEGASQKMLDEIKKATKSFELTLEREAS
jgi:hypothetical protein